MIKDIEHPDVAEGRKETTPLLSRRRWHLYYRRPLAVGVTGVSLAILSVIAMATIPFLLAVQQMNSYSAHLRVEPFIGAGIQLGGAIVILIAAIGILNGHNWARWFFLLFAACGIAAAYTVFPRLFVVPVGLLYGLFAVLLLRPRSGRFFRM